MQKKSYLLLCKDLHDDIAPDVWPQGYYLQVFTQAMMPAIYSLLAESYEQAGNELAEMDAWWQALSSDGEFEAELIFPVADENGQIAGFAQCWNSGFIKDIVVHPAHRKRGLGEALLSHSFHVFAGRGLTKVCLKVETDNPHGAERLYRRVGMAEE